VSSLFTVLGKVMVAHILACNAEGSQSIVWLEPGGSAGVSY
jgi:hypothetical protein